MSVETLEVNTTNYTLEVTNGTTQTLEVTEGITLDLLLSEMGLQGPAGPAGKSISSVVKTSTAGLVDTYTITFSDSTTQTFTVTNGTDGIDGVDGVNGRGIVSITRSSGTGAAGTTDTYTITYTDSTTSTFTVYNGADGVSSGGTVTSVALTVPTGLSVANSPVTTSGSLDITYQAGYSIPTTVKQGQWDTAYGWGNHALAGYLTNAAIGSTVQAYDADLTSWAAISPSEKQDTLVSGSNIKTINSTSLLGAGNIVTGDVTLTGAQTLTNKTIGLASNTIAGTKTQFNTSLTDGDFLFSGDAVPITGGIASGLTLNDGYTEEVFAVTDTAPALSPTNGSIQTWTLTGNATPTAGTWGSGQSMTLMVDDGSARTINWASMSVTWKTGGGTAPTLLTSGYTVIELAKVGATLYGWMAGDA